jgi:hypothetical protein
VRRIELESCDLDGSTVETLERLKILRPGWKEIFAVRKEFAERVSKGEKRARIIRDLAERLARTERTIQRIVYRH